MWNCCSDASEEELVGIVTAASDDATARNAIRQARGGCCKRYRYGILGSVALVIIAGLAGISVEVFQERQRIDNLASTDDDGTCTAGLVLFGVPTDTRIPPDSIERPWWGADLRYQREDCSIEDPATLENVFGEMVQQVSGLSASAVTDVDLSPDGTHARELLSLAKELDRACGAAMIHPESKSKRRAMQHAHDDYKTARQQLVSDVMAARGIDRASALAQVAEFADQAGITGLFTAAQRALRATRELLDEESIHLTVNDIQVGPDTPAVFDGPGDYASQILRNASVFASDHYTSARYDLAFRAEHRKPDGDIERVYLGETIQIGTP